MVLYSASRRTDMVAFYPDEICATVARSRKLEGIVFWTKDPRNLLDHPGLHQILTQVPSVVQLTITGLAGSAWEPDVPPVTQWQDSLAELGRCLPAGAIVWRFDPIIADASLQKRFASLCDRLDKQIGPLQSFTTSFVDPYPSVRTRLAQADLAIPPCPLSRQREILQEMHAYSGLPIELCCEPDLLDLPFTRQASCISTTRFDTLYQTNIAPLEKDAGQRVACGCVRSRDIGSYAMRCGHNCRYCYARPENDVK